MNYNLSQYCSNNYKNSHKPCNRTSSMLDGIESKTKYKDEKGDG